MGSGQSNGLVDPHHGQTMQRSPGTRGYVVLDECRDLEIPGVADDVCNLDGEFGRSEDNQRHQDRPDANPEAGQCLAGIRAILYRELA